MFRKNILVMASTLALAGPIFAQDSGLNEPTPQGVIQHCTRSLARATKRTVRAMRHISRHSVTIITHLKQEGREEAAAAVAQGSANVIGQIAERGLSRVAEIAARCAERLGEIGAPPEAFDVLDERVERAVGAIAQAEEAALARIEQALAGT